MLQSESDFLLLPRLPEHVVLPHGLQFPIYLLRSSNVLLLRSSSRTLLRQAAKGRVLLHAARRGKCWGPDDKGEVSSKQRLGPGPATISSRDNQP